MLAIKDLLVFQQHGLGEIGPDLFRKNEVQQPSVGANGGDDGRDQDAGVKYDPDHLAGRLLFFGVRALRVLATAAFISRLVILSTPFALAS